MFLVLVSTLSFSKPTETSSAGIAPHLTVAQANTLAEKLQQLSSPSLPSIGKPKPVVITDSEANSYLRFRGSEFLPHGVSDTVLHIEPKGIYGTALVDFKALNLGPHQNDMGAKLLQMIFQGTQRVSAFGKLSSGDGKATLAIENVKVGKTQLNDWLVNWLLQYYLQSNFKIDLSKPLPLPNHVSRIVLRSGQATVMRSAAKR